MTDDENQLTPLVLEMHHAPFLDQQSVLGQQTKKLRDGTFPAYFLNSVLEWQQPQQSAFIGVALASRSSLHCTL